MGVAHFEKEFQIEKRSFLDIAILPERPADEAGKQRLRRDVQMFALQDAVGNEAKREPPFDGLDAREAESFQPEGRFQFQERALDRPAFVVGMHEFPCLFQHDVLPTEHDDERIPETVAMIDDHGAAPLYLVLPCIHDHVRQQPEHSLRCRDGILSLAEEPHWLLPAIRETLLPAATVLLLLALHRNPHRHGVRCPYQELPLLPENECQKVGVAKSPVDDDQPCLGCFETPGKEVLPCMPLTQPTLRQEEHESQRVDDAGCRENGGSERLVAVDHSLPTVVVNVSHTFGSAILVLLHRRAVEDQDVAPSIRGVPALANDREAHGVHRVGGPLGRAEEVLQCAHGFLCPQRKLRLPATGVPEQNLDNGLERCACARIEQACVRPDCVGNREEVCETLHGWHGEAVNTFIHATI